MSGIVGHVGILLAAWRTVLQFVPDSTSSGWSGYTIRQRIDASRMRAGQQLRLVIDTTGQPMNLSAMYVGVEAVGGGYDFDTTPVQVLFGGSGTIATAGGVFRSDTLSLAQDGTRNLILSAYFSGTTTIRRRSSGITAEKYANVLGNQASVVDWSGFTETMQSWTSMATTIQVK